MEGREPESEGQKGEDVAGETQPPDESQPMKVIGWASQLSAEERGWVDASYQPPREVIELVKRLLTTKRSFHVLTGLWGVGKSSALQFINDELYKSDRQRRVAPLRLSPDTPVLDQITEDEFLWDNSYLESENSHAAERMWKFSPAFRKRVEDTHGGFLSWSDVAKAIEARDLSVEDLPVPNPVVKRLKTKGVILSLALGTDDLLLDLPDFSRTDRRLLVRTLDQIQDLWLKVMKAGAEDETVPGGPNFVITLQKELADLAPSYFLGKANVVEIKPLSPPQLVSAYTAKFQIVEPFTEDALQYLAILSRGIFRRFLKYIALTLQAAAARGIEIVKVTDLLPSEDRPALINADMIAKEMEPEFASIFPKPEPRARAAQILHLLIERDVPHPPPEPGPHDMARLFAGHHDTPMWLPPPTQKDIADLLSMEESTVSRILDRMEEHGTIMRERTAEGNIVRLKW